ncbi:MAG: amidohydrolase family protein [bacterium]|nr:amidohydrolase family protein [bacterium]
MIDVNTFLGNWAFRRLRHNDVDGLLGMMNRFGIARACVASADAILYKDCQEGNKKLHEDTRGHEDRFLLYATINPAYGGWERDLADCVSMGFCAVRMYPYYHGYTMDGPEAAALLDAAAEAGVLVSVPGRVVDMRQRHWMDVIENLDPSDILGVAEKHPDTTLILTECIVAWPDDDDRWKRMADLPVHVEISRMTSCLGRNIQGLVKALGPERVLFGTGFPFKTPSPVFLKLQVLDAEDAAKTRIVEGNAQALFGGD